MLDPGVVHAAREAKLETRPLGRAARWLGPGAVVSIAYVDPGNFATNVQAGSELGTRLLWVVAVASLAAMLIQYLAAKLGSVTGRSLPELCRERYPRPVTWGLWLQAELVIMATDLAEVLGGALALGLLFGVPLPIGGVAVAGVSLLLLMLKPDQRRRFHGVVGAALILILFGFLYQAWGTGVSGTSAVAGLVPGFGGDRGVVLAAGIVGATVMPHAIYLHTGLARSPSAPTLGGHAGIRWHKRDIVITLGLAGFANMLILLVAAKAMSGLGAGGAEVTLDAAYDRLQTYGGFVAGAFALALLVSGLAASGVGTQAGDVVMLGYLRRRIPTLLRRLLTLAPALVVVSIGTEPTKALVFSQVLLSLGIPFAIIPLIVLTSQRRVMGSFTNHPLCTAIAGLIAAAICLLNLSLVVQTVS